jgi:transcriptional antiterminator NusG
MLQDNKTPHWYVVHTYSGYENKVATNLEKIVENRNLGHLIFSIKVPVEEIEVDGKKEEHKLFPSYVLVKMIMNDESWHVVRNTTGVTGFVGPGSQPVVLLDEEVEALGVDTDVKSLDFAVNDTVEITGGPLAGIITSGKVLEISDDQKKVKLLVSMGGRESAIELDASCVKKL